MAGERNDIGMPPMADLDLLRATEMFAEIQGDSWDRIVAAARTIDLRRGDVLFREGDHPDQLFVVEDGRIAIATRSVDGRESVIALMERGDLFGEMPMLDGQGRSADARRSSRRS